MTQRLGWIVPEIEIENLLAAGYAELDGILADDATADPFLERVFWNVPAARRARFKTWLRDHVVKIVENYPRSEQELPCHAIVLSPGESHEFVGHVGNTLEATVDSPGGPVTAEQWSPTIGILTRGKNPEELLVLHQLAKFFIARQRYSLAETFEINLSMSERDLGYVREFAPHFVYDRLLQVHVSFLQMNAADIPTTEITDVTPVQETAYANA
jgi:hypothetical protein